jgi:2-methylcitrate dehydratase PrpD
VSAKSGTPVTDAIIDFVQTATLQNVPSSSLARGSVAMIDTAAVAVAGAATDAAKALRRSIQVSGGPTGPAMVIGTTQRATALDATLLNGFAAHALDFDDTIQGLVTHPSCHLVPALLTAAEVLAPNATTLDLTLAHLVGIEVEARLARTLNPGHGERGWHATGTLGSIASTAAVCQLIDVDVSALRNALAIASSSASGLRGNFGTHVKPLHAGHAARTGLEAALLATSGIQGATDALEHRFGFFQTYSGPDFQLTAEHWDVSEMLRFQAPLQLTFKPYPCCGEATGIVQAALELRALSEMQNALGEIDEIIVHVTTFGRNILEFDTPNNPDQARFSGQYCVAAALINGGLGIEQFAESAVAAGPERLLMQRITVVPDGALAPHGGAVELRLRDGRVVAREIKEPKGHCTVEMLASDVREKFHGCADATLGPDRAGRLLAQLSAADGPSAGWLPLLTPTPPCSLKVAPF